MTKTLQERLRLMTKDHPSFWPDAWKRHLTQAADALDKAQAEVAEGVGYVASQRTEIEKLRRMLGRPGMTAEEIEEEMGAPCELD